MNNEGAKNRGKICRLCERKFCVRLMLQEQFEKIDAQQRTIDGFQEQLSQKKKEYNEVNKRLEEEAQKGKNVMDNLGDQKASLKTEVETLVNEVKSMISEVTNLETRKQELIKDHQDVIQTIDSTRDEITQLSEDIKQTEVKRRELDAEKIKLEEEIAKYQKQGKQPKNGKQGGKGRTATGSFLSRKSRNSEVSARGSTYSIRSKRGAPKTIGRSEA